ncbi:uncharacterized protein [Venturia canescens]|uniref:uncharacterized protein n=1 Tax=Venturia canescens TaxID=32260 RepID=UPI001C9BCC43|nr:uncharacterized protein LOC122410865 [Venturia canescens]
MGKGKTVKRNCAPEVTVVQSETPQRNVIPSSCPSFFTRCFKKNHRRRREVVNKPYPEEPETREIYDYIVEKLVIKRVPISLFAMSHDTYDTETKSEDCGCEKNTSTKVGQSTKSVYSIAPAANSLFYIAGKSEPSTSGFTSNGKMLRFTPNENDQLESYNDNAIIRQNLTKKLDKFTALHPNLKESERVPKDPCPLNTASKSRRSLAEEISEISSTTKIETSGSSNITKDTSTNEATNKNNVKFNGPSGSSSVSRNQEIPTRDKPETTETSSNRSRNENISCFPFGRRYFESRNHEVNDPDDTAIKNTNYTIAPVQVHYNSPNLMNIRKSIKKNLPIEKSSSNLDHSIVNTSTENQEIENPKTCDSCETSERPEISNDQKADNLAGTTLRWKIIIKHHPPENPKKIDKKEQIGSTMLPTPNKIPPYSVVGMQKYSFEKSKIDQDSRQKRKK